MAAGWLTWMAVRDCMAELPYSISEEAKNGTLERMLHLLRNKTQTRASNKCIILPSKSKRKFRCGYRRYCDKNCVSDR